MLEYTFEDDEKPVIRPVSIQGFSRYDIYPEGRIIDKHTQKPVLFNKHLNFVWFSDEEPEKPTVDNLRNLIRDLVRMKVPGFENELPPYRPPDIYEELRTQMEKPELQKPKELHFLRKEHASATESLLADVLNVDKQLRYKKATDALEFFKSNHPTYYKWPIFAEVPEKMGIEEEKALLDEWNDLQRELEEVKAEIKYRSDRLRGILELIEFNPKSTYGIGAGTYKIRS